jgi:hypothetical protein
MGPSAGELILQELNKDKSTPLTDLLKGEAFTMKKPAPKGQEWSQKRNFAKRRISMMQGTATALSTNPILTVHERDMMTQINLKLTNIMTKFPQRNAKSKHDYLEEN